MPHERTSVATTDPELVLQARGLVRKFGYRRVVDDVTFSVARGGCLALFGPNGAGKTTLLRIVAGLLTPSSGSCTIDGVSARDGAEARARVGLISHSSMLYASLTARENVEFCARMYGVADPRDAAMRALATLRVDDRADAPVRALSRGLQQRVSIARAIVHAPRVLLCDEPYTGLDTIGNAALTTALLELRDAGTALVLVTHNLDEGLALGTHTAIMASGKLLSHQPNNDANTSAYADRYREMMLSQW